MKSNLLFKKLFLRVVLLANNVALVSDIQHSGSASL